MLGSRENTELNSKLCKLIGLILAVIVANSGGTKEIM
jgi:hypothetical protein